MPERKLLRIEWKGPFTVDTVMNMSNNEDYGLYQIYAHHLVFGLDALVYIGMAKEQTFAVRFAQHWETWLKWETDVSVRLGRIFKTDYRNDDDWGLLLSDAESLTISWHTPPYNSQHINGYYGKELHVQNWGNHGSLLPEYSSHWRPLRPDDSLTE